MSSVERKQTDTSATPDVTNFLDADVANINSLRVSTYLGLAIGAVTMLWGLIASLLGLQGTVEWFIVANGVSMKLLNATPGVLLLIIGLIIVRDR